MSANRFAEGPVGVWSGLVSYHGKADEIMVSFADDGTVALRTPVSTGRGSWAPAGAQRFSYHLKEELGPETGMAGHLDIEVDAQLDGAQYRGVSTATISDPAGVVVRTISAQVTVSRLGTVPADWHVADGEPAHQAS